MNYKQIAAIQKMSTIHEVRLLATDNRGNEVVISYNKGKKEFLRYVVKQNGSIDLDVWFTAFKAYVSKFEALPKMEI